MNKKIKRIKYGDGRDGDTSCYFGYEPQKKLINRTVHVRKIKAVRKNKWL